LDITRRQFDLGARGTIPPDLYRTKIKDWFYKVNVKDIAHLYYACAHPACAERVENWILKDDFERDYLSRGLTNWRCLAGHSNSVLPSDDEIRDYNKNLLLHPEYYQEYMGVNLRRYRLCHECIGQGFLTLCVHDGGCKHWPGSGTGHRHIFCFSCLKVWGSQCDHSTVCRDPGIQQVRKVGDPPHLEVGYVNAQEYLRWLQGSVRNAPPTIWVSGYNEDGNARQSALGMTNKAGLLAESRQGTT
jgi:hypothetical protein